MLTAPPAAVALVKRWEGFHRIVQRTPVVLAGPYRCPALVPTIGYGTVVDSMDYPPITEADAEELLMHGSNGLNKCVAAAYRICPVLLNEPERHRVAAVASFIYNLGAGNFRASTLRRRINQKNWAEAEREFHRWVYAGGRKLAGLIARRADEAALFSGAYN